MKKQDPFSSAALLKRNPFAGSGAGDLRPRSGALPYRKTPDGRIMVMLVTPVGGGKWIPPKGNIERNMTPAQSASKEALEEAGVVGECEEHLLGVCRFGKRQSVEIYPLAIREILDVYEESDRRSRHLFDLKEAMEEISDRDFRSVLNNLSLYLKEGL